MPKKIDRSAKTQPKTPSKKKVKKTVTTKKSRSSTASIDLNQFLVPGVIAFVIMWLITANVTLAGTVFLAVLIGSWFGQTYKKR